jgi:hypothetical protein
MKTEFVSTLAEQRQIDAQRARMADEIVAGQQLDSLEEAKRFARGWIITAAQHSTNEEYYRKQRDWAVAALKQVAAMGGEAGAVAEGALTELFHGESE